MCTRIAASFGVVLAMGAAACGASSSDAGAGAGGSGGAGGAQSDASTDVAGGDDSPDAALDAPADTSTGGAAGDGAVAACACTTGVTAPCSDLGKLYASDGKTATCKADCSAWDVSACSYDASGAKMEQVYPALRDARFADAKCNDGTPFSFHVSLTGSRRWIVSFEGGGACDGALIPCQPRLSANPNLFSTNGNPADGAILTWASPDKGILSRDKTVNPTFADANVAVGNYCSSDLWTGTSTTPVKGDVSFDLLFAGRLNARAMLQTLIERYGLDDAKDIDIIDSGSSAGGNGARNNADLFADAFPNAKAAKRIWVLPVAGFQIYQWTHAGAGVMGTDDPDPASWDFIYPRWSAEANAKCQALVAADGHGPGACLPGLYSSRSLVLPEPAGYGLRVLDATNRTDPVYLGYHAVTPATPDFTAIADAWEPIVTSEMLASNLRWLLAPAHRGKPNLHGIFDVWTTPLPAYDAAKDPCNSPWPASIETFRDLVDAFYADTSPDTSGIKICPPDGWPP